MGAFQNQPRRHAIWFLEHDFTAVAGLVNGPALNRFSFSTSCGNRDEASASSTQNLRIEPLEFCPGVVNFELPVHGTLLGVGLLTPDPDFRMQQWQFADAPAGQALARQATQLAFGDVQPTAVLGCMAEVDPLDVGSRFLGRERRVERSFGVRVEVVAHQRHLRTSSVTRVQQCGHFDRPVELGPMFTSGCLAKARQRLREHEDARRAIALVLVIDPLRVILRRLDGYVRHLHQLQRLFVHAQHRVLRIIRFGIGLEHVLHVGHELGVLVGWNHPVLDLALGHSIFFRVLRTVSAQIEETTSNATNSSASNFNDHRPYPAGGFPSRIAISFASPSPSSLRGVGGVARFLRSSAASTPAVTNRSRRFSTVRTEQSYASAILSSDHPGPSASALSRIWARLTFSEVPLSRFTTSWHTARSSSDSRTIYFLFMGHLRVLTSVPE